MNRMTHHSTRITVLLVLGILAVCTSGLADTFSHILSFQGRLAEPATGKPVPDGPYAVQFTIYDADEGGTALWQETQGVTQVGGVFVAYLGSVTPFPEELFADGDRWLGIKVGEDPEMPNRFRLTPSPWAIRAATADAAGVAETAGHAEHAAWSDIAGQAENADTVDGLHASEEPIPNYIFPLGPDGKFPPEVLHLDDDWAMSGMDIYRLDGNVGIGDMPPPHARLWVSTGSAVAAEFTSRGEGAAGVFQIENEANYSPAVLALSDGLSSETHIIHAEAVGTAMTDGVAVYGEFAPADYYGYGGYFVGGYRGAVGLVQPDGAEIYTGLTGLVSGGSGINTGVDGTAVGLGTNYGVVGRASGGAVNYAGFFEGNLHATGDITKEYSGGEKCRIAPIAYATIASDGSVLSGTSNVSCTWNSGASQYEITIQGESYDSDNYTTAATSASGLYIAWTSSIGGKLVVSLANLGGHKVQTKFGFVTYMQ